MTAPLLYVSGEYPPDVGGVGDYTARLRQALLDRDWPSRVLSRRQVRRWDARALLWLVRTAPARGIVHIQYQPGAFDLLGDVCLMPALLRRVRPNVRSVTTLHDARPPYLFPRAGALRQRAVALLAGSSHAVIAADARDLAILHVPHAYQVPIGSNIPCMPPPGYARAEFRRRLGLADSTLAVVYFGLLNASKGLDDVLAAFETASAALNGNARLLLLGGRVGASDPTDRQTARDLESRIAALGSRVIQPGYLAPTLLSAYLLAGDVALLPFKDGASARRGSLLACAAHGLPIVTTLPASPAVADAVKAVPRAELAEAVLRASRDPEQTRLRKSAAALAKQTAWPTIANSHIDIYTALLQD